MAGDKTPENEYFLDEEMLRRFSLFLDACAKYNIKVIVGLITGWMSGRLYVPAVLFGKNVLSDPTAIYLEQLFIRGFIGRFKDRGEILAWDLGNECNCMASVSRIEAVNWTATVASAIRAADPTRRVVSGMSCLNADRGAVWQTSDHAMWTDIFTTHPYPYWGDSTRNDNLLSLRTILYPTAMNKYYAECGGRPTLAEELGTMGPMMSSNEVAADYLRANLFSLWSNDAIGLMWWCAHEQTMLTAYPYSDFMVERELGLLNPDKSPKPVMNEIKKFKGFLDTLDINLPSAYTDAVCLLSRDQHQWGVCYTSHVLATMAGLNFSYVSVEEDIPEADTYLLPSVNGLSVIDATRYNLLLKRVYEGATLYISMDNGIIAGFSELVGARVVDSHESGESLSFTLGGEKYSTHVTRYYALENSRADIKATDNYGNPIILENRYGKGRVIYLNFPLEANLVGAHNGFDGNLHKLYENIFADKITSHPIKIAADGVYTTLHIDDDGGKIYTVSVNFTAEQRSATIEAVGYKLTRTIYGNPESISGYDALVLEFSKI